MLDYDRRLNGVPTCMGYDDLRHCKLEEPLYPAGGGYGAPVVFLWEGKWYFEDMSSGNRKENI